MIIKMRKGASQKEIRLVVLRVEGLGFEVQINKGEERVVIGVFGSNTGCTDIEVFEVLSGVEKVFRIQEPFKLASNNFRQNTVIRVGGVEIGGNKLVLMGGPCSVESERQILECAHEVKEAGGDILRGGAFKPRTSPFAFQGLKENGLKMLAKARERTGLLVVTEVVSPQDVDLVASYADMLQIGARNMQNYPLLEVAGKSKKPVLLKRGLSATLEELLMAADYILHKNEKPNVILCLRGIRTFDNSTRFTCDFGDIPVLKQLTHLPVIADPSHVAGNFRYVPAIAKMAVAGGADGLIIEIHPNPKKAMTDGAQSLTFPDFHRLMNELRLLAQALGREI